MPFDTYAPQISFEWPPSNPSGLIFAGKNTVELLRKELLKNTPRNTKRNRPIKIIGKSSAQGKYTRS